MLGTAPVLEPLRVVVEDEQPAPVDECVAPALEFAHAHAALDLVVENVAPAPDVEFLAPTTTVAHASPVATMSATEILDSQMVHGTQTSQKLAAETATPLPA